MGGTGIMRQGFRNYSAFGYRPISLSITSGTGHTSSDILVDGRQYRVITFSAPANTTTNYSARINNIGNELNNDVIDVLVVGGGGGGGSSRGGGGGAGGLVIAKAKALPYTTIGVTVGAGGAAATTGTYSQIYFDRNTDRTTLTAQGGGRGGSHLNVDNGQAGGSGGGAAMNYSANIWSGGANSPGTKIVTEGGGSFVPTFNQYGNAGAGSGSQGTDAPRNSGGGGGAGTAGVRGSGTSGSGVKPNGGSGVSSSITGSLVTYAGGGGGARGGTDIQPIGAGAGYGGAGGGGNGGGDLTQSQGVDGLGGGGGGSEGTGSRGGSGVVIIRYPIGPEVPKPSMTATGGQITEYTSGGKTYRSHTFSSVGQNTFNVSALGAESYGNFVEFIVVGGGGSGGTAGGGAGGFLLSSATVEVGSYTVNVGAGGPSNYAGTPSNGGSSSIIGAGMTDVVAIGGGRGGSAETSGNGYYGASGGGAGVYWNGSANVAGTPGNRLFGLGNVGSAANAQLQGNGSGGGAGTAGQGYVETGYDYMGNPYSYWVTSGGAGRSNTFFDGTTRLYAGGGVGADIGYVENSIFGGGGTSGAPSYSGYNGTPNTGGGGGGGFDYQGAGGSGIVIIRYRIA
jgi:hypothetical protein